MARVVLNNICKVFPGDIQAVKDFNLEVNDKEFVVLVGPSGCGKSTTLRMIAGLEDISSGDIHIDNVLINSVPPKDRNTAMVFQNYALYPHMSVYKNMAFGLKLRKYQSDEIHKRVMEAGEILGLKTLMERKPKALSGGQRQRVAVGRAIVRKPKVFLFDEPLSNLDAKMRVEMRNEISRLHTRLRSTMIYVTHDQVEAMTMGDRIVVMKDGLIQQIDAPLDLYNRPKNKFVAGFIGTPPMNFLPGKLLSKNGFMFIEGDGFSLKIVDEMADQLSGLVGKSLILGLRPEDIYDKLFYGDASPQHIITAKVEVTEPMGPEIFLYLNVKQHSIIARVEANSQVSVNQEVDFVVDMNKIHLFDVDTENLIV